LYSVHIPYSEVSILTRLPRKRGSTPSRDKRYFFKILRPFLAPHSPLQWVNLLRFSPRVKRPGHEADNFSPSSARRVLPHQPPQFPFMACVGTTLPNLYTLGLALGPTNTSPSETTEYMFVSLPIARYWFILFLLYLLSAIQFTTSFGRRAIYKSPTESKPK